IRGFRIELGEVESVLNRHAAVAHAVVLVHEESAGHRRLVAYAVPQGEPPKAEELEAWLSDHLPPHMVPTSWVFLDTLPLTPNGKIDRRRLPEPPPEGEGEPWTPIRTPVEGILAAEWNEVLGRQRRLGRLDHFFRLGGHSLLATRLLARIQDRFGVHLPIAELFAHPVLQDQAVVVEKALRGTTEGPPPVAPRPEGSPTPLSFSQQQLWLFEQANPDLPVYNIPERYPLEGSIVVAALARALETIVARHEVLRSPLIERAGSALQDVRPPMALPLPVIDLSGLGLAAAAEAEGLEAREAGMPLRCEALPLLRPTLIRLAPHSHTLLVTLHHAVADGWSLDVFNYELALLYGAAVAGRANPLPPLPVQYADFALWQRRRLRGSFLEQEVDHWRRRLDGLPAALELPTDRPRPAVSTFRGDRLPLALPAPLIESLRDLGRSHGATLYMTLLGAFQLLLHRHSGQDDLAVGTPNAQRPDRRLELLMGFFVNMVVLRSTLTREPSVGSYLERVRDTALEAYGHQELPFEVLVRQLKPQRDRGRNPFFQVLFQLLAAAGKKESLDGLTGEPENRASGTAKFDLELSLTEVGTAVAGYLEYSTELFDTTTIRRLLRQYRTLLEDVAHGDSTRPVTALRLLGAAERHQLKLEWNDRQRVFSGATVVHELVAETVRRSPDLVAVRYPGGELTYRELDGASGELAARLRAMGVGPDVRVALCLERSPELMVAVLAVLRAGGAYVPLDPEYPAERLRLMLDDCRARVLVTRRSLLERLPESGAAVLCLDPPGSASDVPTGPADPPGPAVHPDHLAYVIYT
ncbi:MAG: AMP-binding protein, partial [Acidobacteria bacterium]|nr:AMP-binding protein [Acidobacteriota bacterium]